MERPNARKTHGDKIDELMKFAAISKENQKRAEREIERSNLRLDKVQEIVAALEKNYALQEHKVQELWEGKKEFMRRLWMIAGPLLAAILGFLLRGCVPAN